MSDPMSLKATLVVNAFSSYYRLFLYINSLYYYLK